jgi:ribonuclease inhibitor
VKYCIIDGAHIASRRELHKILAESLEFPQWYGNNLDALYDCLTDEHEEIQIELRNAREMEQNLGIYAARFKKVLSDASAENPRIKVMLNSDITENE